MKTHWKKLTNPNFLGAYSFEENEKERTLIIKEVKKELVKGVGGRSNELIVAYFTNGKPMILNKTNCKTITLVHKTPFIEEWCGLSIVIHVELIAFAGERIPSLRVINAAVKPEKKELSTNELKKLITDLNQFKIGLSQARQKYKGFEITKEQGIKIKEAGSITETKLAEIHSLITTSNKSINDFEFILNEKQIEILKAALVDGGV